LSLPRAESLVKFRGIAGEAPKKSIIIYGGEEAFTFKDTRVLPWNVEAGWSLGD
jgi:hypothetical protein